VSSLISFGQKSRNFIVGATDEGKCVRRWYFTSRLRSMQAATAALKVLRGYIIFYSI